MNKKLLVWIRAGCALRPNVGLFALFTERGRKRDWTYTISMLEAGLKTQPKTTVLNKARLKR